MSNNIAVPVGYQAILERSAGDSSGASTSNTSSNNVSSLKPDESVPSLRRLRGVHKRSSPRASKACTECRR